MVKEDIFKVTFWGVRGSYPQCRPDFLRVGGHTSCVSLEVEREYFIFDAGSGLIDLGNRMSREEIKKATLLVSHPHADHISGLGFFKPMHDPGFTLTIVAGKLPGLPGRDIKSVLSYVISPPYFPLPWDEIACQKVYRDVAIGTQVTLKGVKISTIALNHPGGSCGYRVAKGNKSICYITDTTHIAGRVDKNLTAFIQGTDLLIYDAMFTEKEFTLKADWGHSTWNQAVALGQAAGVREIALFHHSPDHDDALMDTIESQARLQFPAAFVARQGMEWIL